MNLHTHSRYAFLAFGLAFVFALPAAAATTIEHAGWLYGEEADKAIELAQEHNVPVAILYTFRETTCPKCVGAARQMASAKSTKKMVRIMHYYGKGSDELNSSKAAELFKATRGQAKDKSNIIPDLYFVMPDGRALGMVPYEEAASAESEAKAVSQIGAWLKDVPEELEKADRNAEKGRFEAALKAIDKIIEQDAKVSHIIQVQLGQVEEDEEKPETPASLFFPNLKQEKASEYKALAMEKIAEAEKLIEKEELRDARRLLRTLLRAPDDFEAKAKAEALMEKVTELLKAS